MLPGVHSGGGWWWPSRLEASPQSGLGVSRKWCSSCKKTAWAECMRAGAAHKHSYLILCSGGFLVPVSPAQRDEARRCAVNQRNQQRPFEIYF